MPDNLFITGIQPIITLCFCSLCAAAAQLASGEVFGKNQPVALQLLGSNRSFEALEGVAMELEDSLYPLLREVHKHSLTNLLY
jgi:hypothetical protein